MSSKIMRPFIVILAVALIFFLSFFVLSLFINEDKAPQPAPDVVGPKADGSIYSLSDNFGKQGVALIFFELEHRHSVEAMQHLIPKAKEQKVEVVAVCVSQLPIEQSLAKMKELEIPQGTHTLFDLEGEMAKAYALTTAPCTYFIDKNGMIRDAYPGPISESSAEKELKALH